MNRSLLVAAIALGAVAVALAVQSRLTVAAMAGRASAAASVASATAAGLALSAANGALGSGVAPPPFGDTPSPETQRLEARRVLYETVEALVHASEFERARKLLDEDQARYGDDLAPEWRDFEQSYRLIADCLEHPSPQRRVRAESFVLVSQALPLKSQILAACSK